MLRYLMSRVSLIFIIKFFMSWGLNIPAHFSHFFHLNVSRHWYLTILSSLAIGLVFLFGTIFLNVVFLFFRLSDDNSFTEIIEKISKLGIRKSLKLFFGDFFHILNENFKNEMFLEKYPKMFLMLSFLFLSYIKGNPLFNNYYGIYKEYEVLSQGDVDENTEYIEKQYYIVKSGDLKTITSTMKQLEMGDYEDEDNDYFEVKKRGYLFFQAALIDGFKSNSRESRFDSYIGALFFTAFEKLIAILIYFFIPFLICISIMHYSEGKSSVEA